MKNADFYQYLLIQYLNRKSKRKMFNYSASEVDHALSNDEMRTLPLTPPKSGSKQNKWAFNCNKSR